MAIPKGSKYVKYGSYSTGVAIAIVAVFFLLSQSGDLNISGYSYSEHCAGTENDICWLEINFTPKADIFIGKDSQWLNTTPPIKDLKLYRSWGSGWREIPLNEGCSGSWCGCYWCRSNERAGYAIVFRNDTSYRIRFEATKYNPDDVINWSINPNGVWGKAKAKEVCTEYKDITKYNITIKKVEEIRCINKTTWVKCKDSVYTNGTCPKTQEVCTPVVITKKEKSPYLERLCVSYGISYANQLINTKGMKCTITADNVYCDDLAGKDGNGDGICQSGETCYQWNLGKSIKLDKVNNGDKVLTKKYTKDYMVKSR